MVEASVPIINSNQAGILNVTPGLQKESAIKLAVHLVRFRMPVLWVREQMALHQKQANKIKQDKNQ